MGVASTIEWCTGTWNPWRGCDKISPGCSSCFMFRDQLRYGRDPSVVVRTSDATFFAPIKAKKWRELPAGSHIFTCSWSDFFHEDADGWRDEAWEVIRQRPDLNWQILTKRPERIPGCLPAWWGDADCEAPENVWLGVSIENRRFVHRADQLRAVPAAVRFISAEPLLGPLCTTSTRLRPRTTASRYWRGWTTSTGGDVAELDLTDIDWVIGGGESGGPLRRRLTDERNQPRADRIGWVRDIRDACVGAGVAFLFKQWGGPLPTSGGRLLDGRTWDEMPGAPS